MPEIGNGDKHCTSGCTCGRHYDRGEVGRKSLHNRVRRLRGKASEYTCENCGKPARDWATVHGADGRDPLNDYLALCRVCHRAYDQVGARQQGSKRPSISGSRNSGHKLSDTQVVRIRKLASEGVPQVKLAERYQVSYTTIQRIVHRRSWSGC